MMHTRSRILRNSLARIESIVSETSKKKYLRKALNLKWKGVINKREGHFQKSKSSKEHGLTEGIWFSGAWYRDGEGGSRREVTDVGLWSVSGSQVATLGSHLETSEESRVPYKVSLCDLCLQVMTLYSVNSVCRMMSHLGRKCSLSSKWGMKGSWS